MNNRPVYLNLFQIRLPVTALVSISHRLSGVILFLLIPFLVWTLDCSLASQESCQRLQGQLHKPWVSCLVWVFLVSLILHLLAGVRHLLMDMHLGDSLIKARYTAKIVLWITALYAVGLILWMWGAQ